jgi:site-specific recombinase XerD
MDRKIGVTHMAFYRGWLQGMPLREVADLYLETGLDLRQAKTTLQWVQDTLRRAALRKGKHGEARLLRLRIEDQRGTAQAQPENLPSIDDFREEADPTGFYSFDELMTMYLERYPQAGDRRAKRRAALIQRQINTLNWLEALLVTDPVPTDPLEAWLDPNIVKRLQNGGIFKLSELIQRISERGFRWYRTVPQLGEIRAKRLLHWIDAYKASLGTLPPHATVEPKALQPSHKTRRLVVLSGPAANPDMPPIVPLEAMLLPLRSTMASARNYAPEEPRIKARNDREAVEAWLNAQSGSPATRRAYRKEAERLILWAMIERGLTLGQMAVDDCSAYRDWLCALGRVDDPNWKYRVPQAQWIAPRYTKRYSPAWRPFEGALSASSVLYALTVSESFTKWLVDARYLDFNPWAQVASPRPVATEAPDLELTRALTPDQWDYVLGCLDAIEDEHTRLRARLMLRFTLVTGTRLAEVASAIYGNVYTKGIKGSTAIRWMLKILGKGAKWRNVPITNDVVTLMRQNLRVMGLPDDPLAKSLSETRIVGRLDGLPLAENSLAKIFKSLFKLAADKLRHEGRFDEAGVFDKASTHWIRHTTGAMLGDAGAPASQIQQLLGHVSIATTSIYTSTADEQLYNTVAKVF